MTIFSTTKILTNVNLIKTNFRSMIIFLTTKILTNDVAFQLIKKKQFKKYGN